MATATTHLKNMVTSSKLATFMFRKPQSELLQQPISTFIPKNHSLPCHSFASVSEPNVFHDPWCRRLNKKISDMIRIGRLDEARAVFDNMKHRNTVTWNSMMSGYVKSRKMTDARKLFDEMPQRDVVSWNLLISAYITSGSMYMEEARCLFERMPERDVISWNTMISGYARSGRITDALQLFNSMPEKNVVTWNAMISGFLQNGDARSAIDLFKRMPERDPVSLSSLVSGLVLNGEMDNAAGLLLDFGIRDGRQEGLLQAYNILIAGYGQRGRIDDARRLFDHIPTSHETRKGERGRRFMKNVISWNTMIMSYVKAGDLVSARSLFDQMTERDAISWNTMISGYVQMSDMEEASNLFQRAPKPDTATWNSMISGYAELGQLANAQEFFRRMPEKNLVTWNSIIAAYEENGDYRGAILLFNQMQIEGQRPDRHTLSSVLSASAGFANLQLGVQLHQQVMKTVVADIPINNSLITMYSRCGAIKDALAVFHEMKTQKDVISWNAMIGGYASHGYAHEALQVFEVMKRSRVWPTHITFISVLNACAHVGLVEEGKRQFRSMVSEFSIKPRIEHYASLVDIVGRYGQLEEAMDIMKKMPFEPDKTVWGAILGASRVHDNLELAKVAAEALMKLEPESSAPYVMLYNMYADVGLWDDAAQVRTLMEKNKIPKQLAHSCVGSAPD